MIRFSLVVIIAINSICLAGCTSLQEFHPTQEREYSSEQGCPMEAESLFQRTLDEAINKHALVGAQVSLSVRRKFRCHLSSGTTELDRKEFMLPNHLIRLGSLTKTYTAVVILRLVEKGLITLDSPISKWFPGFEFSDQVTIEMLLNHSSGIREILGFSVMLRTAIKSTRVWSTDELLETIFKQDLEFPAGNDNHYSNSNYILLGIIAERVSGKSLEALYHEEIFNPLGLTQTAFLPYESTPPELVTGFDRDLIFLPGWHSIKPHNTAWSSLAYASGAMAATASDVLKFFEAIMSREIVSDVSYDLMTSFTRARSPKDIYLENFGLGLFRYGDTYQHTYGHQGLFVGSETIVLFDPEKQFVFVLLANVSRIKDRDALIQRYLGAIDGK